MDVCQICSNSTSVAPIMESSFEAGFFHSWLQACQYPGILAMQTLPERFPGLVEEESVPTQAVPTSPSAKVACCCRAETEALF